jgi:uncharacterized membrane protein SirB2
MTTAGTPRADRAAGSVKALGFAIAVLGAAMAVMGFVAPVGVGARATEVAAGALAALGGVLLLTRGMRAAMASGSSALFASLVYLAVTNTEFHEGGVEYSVGVVQFVTVPIGLVLGGTAFALTPEGRGTRRVSDFVPDGVLLVVGTILLGIGLGQLGNERLMTPRWNWVSFIGLTVSGMLVLIVLRGALKAALGRHQPSRGMPRFLGMLGTELLLVGGLGLMMYGALNNLGLGTNGFRTGFEGNSEGLVVWIAAALFLIVVRGGFKMANSSERGGAYAVVTELLYFVGAFAFIVGERSVLSGKPPAVPIGGALPAAAAILFGALFLLVPVRVAAKQGRRQRETAQPRSTDGLRSRV